MQGFIYGLNNLELFFMNMKLVVMYMCNVYKQKPTNELYETLLCNYIFLRPPGRVWTPIFTFHVDPHWSP